MIKWTVSAAVAALMMTAVPAYAYLDPGTGSMILQGAIAAVAGGLFTAKLYWTKLKSLFKKQSAPESKRP